jgi:hypothetical protein
MFKKLVVCLALAGLAIASAAQHRVTLFEESIVNGTTLKPGDYKLVIEGDKAVLSRGKQLVEAPVSVQKAESKYGTTSVRYNSGDGKQRVQEIRLGGTDTKVVFESGAAAAAGGR